MCSSLHAKSSHPPLAHHYPGHYQCFYGVNSHLAFLSAERARAATTGWRKTTLSLEYNTWWAVPLGFPTGAPGLQPPAR